MKMRCANVFAPILALVFLLSSGCHTAAPTAQNSEMLNRLPAPVAAAFAKQHPHISPARIHARLFPDGTTHYQILYSDTSGQIHEADYFADGRAAP
jgi:hypothetical protein